MFHIVYFGHESNHSLCYGWPIIGHIQIGAEQEDDANCASFSWKTLLLLKM